ncbi:MAG: cytochrome P460 family protein [Gammaproteobacteria bacterium]|nr:cytochrome P460 family protein [Gammaproteobacteria bacterium]
MDNRSTLAVFVVAVALLGAWAPGAAQLELSTMSGDPDNPRRHYRVRNPADLTARAAQASYERLQPALATAYEGSGDTIAMQYQSWRRHNTAPYLSSTHGNYFINNFTNDIAARAYAKYEQSGVMPVGSIIAKDSFAQSSDGATLMGPLFIMEKMAKGFNPGSADWRYRMIRPDGRLLGETNGVGSERVRYCIACHLNVEHQDHLFYVPQAVRVKWPD